MNPPYPEVHRRSGQIRSRSVPLATPSGSDHSSRSSTVAPSITSSGPKLNEATATVDGGSQLKLAVAAARSPAGACAARCRRRHMQEGGVLHSGLPPVSRTQIRSSAGWFASRRARARRRRRRSTPRRAGTSKTFRNLKAGSYVLCVRATGPRRRRRVACDLRVQDRVASRGSCWLPGSSDGLTCRVRASSQPPRDFSSGL